MRLKIKGTEPFKTGMIKLQTLLDKDLLFSLIMVEH